MIKEKNLTFLLVLRVFTSNTNVALVLVTKTVGQQHLFHEVNSDGSRPTVSSRFAAVTATEPLENVWQTFSIGKETPFQKYCEPEKRGNPYPGMTARKGDRI